MRALRIALLCLFCSIIYSTPAQSPSPFTLILSFRANPKLIHTDNLGNLYVLSQTNQLYKYSKNGRLISTLNYTYTGNITQIDATNPMEIYLFYRELNKVIILDNNLAFRGEVDLGAAGVIQASAIARSFDSELWVFDAGDLQLKKITKALVTEQLSGNIKQYIIGATSVSQVIDNTERVFVVDSLNGILVFDIFANYVKTIPIKALREIKVLDKYLFYYKNYKLNRYNWTTAQSIEYSLPDTMQLTHISVEKERLYLQKPDSISIYTY
jgi:hypothetical protein